MATNSLSLGVLAVKSFGRFNNEEGKQGLPATIEGEPVWQRGARQMTDWAGVFRKQLYASADGFMWAFSRLEPYR